MKIYRNLSDFSPPEFPVVTTGTFDGVHLGHKKVLTRLRDIAARKKGETVVFTFSPHPRLVLFPEDNDLKLLTTNNEKISLLESAGIDHLIIFPFNREFSRLSAVEYVRDILVNQIGTKYLVIGYDHHFGRNREGGFEDLIEFGTLYDFEVEEIPAHLVRNINVSSTKIRTALSEGDIKTANTYLGYNYLISGKVVEGKRLGRKMGYPTANIELEEPLKLLPADGVYAVLVRFNGSKYKGMLNIGLCPTINGEKRTIEVNIFDLDEDIYGQELKLEVCARIRNEKKFENVEELKEQLSRDKQKAIGYLA